MQTYLKRKEYFDKRRKEARTKALEYLGGKCSKCGYSNCQAALEFHHLDPSQKDFGLSTNYYLKWENLQNELDKCTILCANCHRELHENLGSGVGIPLPTLDKP